MSDLHCPVRVHLGDAELHPDRIARVLDRTGSTPEEVVAELADLADEFRGEALQLQVPPHVAAEVVRRLTGREGTCVEGDADGWRPLAHGGDDDRRSAWDG